MPGFEHLVAFSLATLAFALLPGPAILYTAAQTLSKGKRAGLLAALGLHIGGLFHVLFAALGLAAVFQLVPSLYAALKLAGALYLLWLGLRLLASAFVKKDPNPTKAAGVKMSFLHSIVVELLNPKTAVFFLAFLPQFVEPSAGLPLWLQFLILGEIVNLAFSLGDLATVWLTGLIVDYAKRSGLAQRVTKALGGSLLIGLGARLALARD